MKHIEASGVAIIKYDGVTPLVVSIRLNKNKGNGYGFPCGKVDFGEDKQSAAIRETMEETGYIVTVDPDVFFEDIEVDEIRQISCLTRIYIATSIVKIVDRVHEHEGDVEIVPLDILAENSIYHAFNRKFKEWYIQNFVVQK